MGFLPAVESRPVRTSGGGNYFRPQDGKNKVRILSDATVGYVYWNNQNKPVRSMEHPGNPTDIRLSDKTGKPESIKYFWAMVVWDYAKEQLAIWEITQVSVQDQLEAFYDNDEWGHPNGYDITISRSGNGMDTKYTVQPSPAKPAAKDTITAYKEAAINLEALLTGDNPFDDGTPAPASAPGHPDWDTFQTMLNKAAHVDEFDEAREWILKPRRLEKIATLFGSVEAAKEQVEKITEAAKDAIPF
ncbi:MAG: hypothetical protein KME45_02945 [Stenomitos rutilans HA7619-LM2]|jgi:hypothetical protein|nr:hypothetical protein [Stenomitos rutilans HA7619-LM2]MBW4469341.1 hypothetical protein [Stenomitos rutilans HA7619-LM2]